MAAMHNRTKSTSKDQSGMRTEDQVARDPRCPSAMRQTKTGCKKQATVTVMKIRKILVRSMTEELAKFFDNSTTSIFDGSSKTWRPRSP
mmetsp:Transcript_37222/g.86830  ORF Transcript_37222/g.86830 Transcript_37222/m.86830 type:complete len:89 (-) Transcript_37222:460-726(-)